VHSTSPATGATGSIDIPVPPGVTKILNLRIAGAKNPGGLTLTLQRVNILNPPQLTITPLFDPSPQVIAPTPTPFINTITIKPSFQPLHPETQAVALLVKANGESDIWFIGAEFA
jgi:hypothetical protein